VTSESGFVRGIRGGHPVSGLVTWLGIAALALTLSACEVNEEAVTPEDPGNPPTGGNPPPPSPPPPPSATDQQKFEATLYPHLTDTDNFCVGCHGVSQDPRFADGNPTVAYGAITSQQKVNLANPTLSRVYVRPFSERHNCGGDASCDRIAADFLAAIQDWAGQAAAEPPTGGGEPAQSAVAVFADAPAVGEFVTLQFDVSSVVGEPATIEMQAAQLDAAGYLFAEPVFVGEVSGVAIRNIRIGVNGGIPVAAQPFRRIDTVVQASGTMLSPLGAVIPVELGPEEDQFHLEFELLGNRQGTVELTPPSSPPLAAADKTEPEFGLRTFSQLNDTMSSLTGIDPNQGDVLATYSEIQDSLPATPDLLAFAPAQQIAIQRLATSYCGAVVADDAFCSGLFGSCAIDGDAKDQVAVSLYERMIGANIVVQPAPADVTAEIVRMIDDLGCANGCTGTQARTVLQASCAAVMSSASITVN
jgi:hypothetical protein